MDFRCGFLKAWKIKKHVRYQRSIKENRMNKNPNTILSIDIGSVSLGAVILSPEKKVLNSAYCFHFGDISGAMIKALEGIDLSCVSWVTATAAASRIRGSKRFDDQLCVIAAARHLVPGVREILSVGGEKFHLIRLGRDGRFIGCRKSTSCAAGTGAFLDQQARRLDIRDAANLSRLASQNPGNRPKIASRCAVFAKTDLAHAQQEGNSLEAICDGLCHGLAKNIADSLFKKPNGNGPVVFCGGVARNNAVKNYIEKITNTRLLVHPMAHLFGALGAAILFIDENLNSRSRPATIRQIREVRDLLRKNRKKKTYTYPPLTLHLSNYPEFESLERLLYPAGPIRGVGMDVEVDLYEPLLPEQRAFIGIDIGSTSTKAVLTTPSDRVLAGFYTRTAGRPLLAVQRLLETISHLAEKKESDLVILGAGTTGSGRKFIGQIIGADLVLDEITAHARAAYQLNPHVDTIIEIGGQDAKFTTLKAGRITSATMNTVCAAGTGSFIEEQAIKLGCPLDQYADMTRDCRAPLSSDRCTVFMERDLNHYLSGGWKLNEVLASVLHSVRENYMVKVATQSRMGEVVCFQGATAKNRALVAAFEQQLNKPIHVSKFCHLTGALGTALVLSDEKKKNKDHASDTGFVGIHFWKIKVPVRTEVCELCTNHCKLSVATVNGRTEAYGFLCGRDYQSTGYVPVKSHAFDLLGHRKKASSFPLKTKHSAKPVIGLPAGVHLVEDLLFWQYFFDTLGFKTITSHGLMNAVREGKPLSGAEFCAPITALHGHVKYLKNRCDFIFQPLYLEDHTRDRDTRRQYCYYTQYAPVLGEMVEREKGAPLLSPLIRYLYTGFHTRMELYRMFKSIPGCNIGFLELTAAFDEANRFKKGQHQILKRKWEDHASRHHNDIRLVLFGRPYTIFSPSLNCGIPGLFQRYGIDCAYQDMIQCDPEETKKIAPLLKEIHWRHAARIVETAQTVAHQKGIYPVLITSFKCSPDAFVRGYFKKIMAEADKPYLVLELDEHDSTVGYETRLEAAIRAFRNHFRQDSTPIAPATQSINPDFTHNKNGKTIILPNWDRLSWRLIEAALKYEGLNAIVMEETPTTIRKSLRGNTGQCIPINAVVEGFVQCIKNHHLNPKDTILWMARSSIACNIALYPHHIKSLLNERGNGMEKAGVYVGNIFFIDFSLRASFNSLFAYMFGGLLRRVACKLRPYEDNPGQVDYVLEKSLDTLYDAFMGRMEKDDALAYVTRQFKKIPITKDKRPKVAIFGDLYTRDNRVMNQDLIRFIEAHGGEVVTTPYTDYARMIANPYFRKWFFEKKFVTLISNKTLMAAYSRKERSYYRYFEPILKEPMARFEDPVNEILEPFNVRMEHTGESLDNLIKVHYIKKHHPDVSLFVQASPAFCCPSLVTEAMSNRIEKVTGVPVVPITYDGTGGRINDVIIPYLKYPKDVHAAGHRKMGRSA